MSYTIFYRAMFIKLSNGEYIPMIENGDNNVYDADTRRRSRSWNSCRWLHETEEQRKRFSLTADEILDAARKEILKTIESYSGQEPAFGGTPYTEEQIRADLGFFNCIKITGHPVTSAKQFLNFMKSGLRNAVTFEEMRSGVRLSWYEKTEGSMWDRRCTDYAKDEEELTRKWTEHLEQGRTPWIELSDANADYAWCLVKNRNGKPERQPKEHNDYYIISFIHSDYGTEQHFCLYSISTRRMRYVREKGFARTYSSQKNAEKVVAKIKSRFDKVKNIWIEKVSRPSYSE